MAKPIDRHELQDLVAHGATLVEVLKAEEYREEHLSGALNIPLAQINLDTVKILDPARPVIVYCWDSA